MNRYCPVDTIVNTDDNHVARDWLISNNIYTDEEVHILTFAECK